MLIEKGVGLYDPKFANMSLREIFSYCLLVDKRIEEFNLNDYMLLDDVKKYFPYFGDQLDNVAIVLFVKNDNIYLLWSTNNDYSGKDIDYLKNFESDFVQYNLFKEACISFSNRLEM